MSKVRVAVIGSVGKSVLLDTSAGPRALAEVAALRAQISAGLGGTIQHRNLQGLQVGDDHPQYTGNQFPETITGQWNFQTIPDIQGETLAEYIEDVVGQTFPDFLEDTTSVVWTYHDTANLLEANVPPEFVQDVVGAMLVDTATVDFTYDDTGGTFSAVVPGAALTKTDDTNVTLTLGGSPTTALARAASLTLGWTGTLAKTRGGFGLDTTTLTGYVKAAGAGTITAAATIPASDVSGGAALTRVNDTNVTLALGGTPASALLAAASLTLGWSGQLSVARGGSGAATLTGYLKGNGASAFTAISSIPASDISSGAALTKVDDTNVTLTLGGTPASALLAASSLTLGWTGTLANSRGGTGTGTYTTGDLLYASASNTLSKRGIGSTNDVLAVVGGVPTWSQAISPTWTGHHQWTSSGRNLLDLTASAINYGNSTDLPLHTFQGTTVFNDHSIIQHATSPYLVFRIQTGALDNYLQIAPPNFNFSAATGYGFTVSVNGAGSASPSLAINSTGLGFNGATPIARPDYTITNPTTNRSIDVSAITHANLAQVVGTMIQDLINYGLYQ